MHTQRLSSTISFDENSEADIIKMIEQLNSQHKMGDFLSCLFRIAVDNPDLLVKNCQTGVYSEGAVVRAVEQIGKTKTRADYIKVTKEKVEEVEKKVDEIYKMCLELKVAFEFGKRNGLESQNENLATANFLLESQLKELRKIVGEKIVYLPANIGEKKKKLEEDAESTLEYIIKSYEPIVTEIIRAAQSVREVPIQEVKVQVEQQPVPQQAYQPVPIYTQPMQQLVQPMAQPVQQVVQQPVQQVVEKQVTPIKNSNTEPKKETNTLDIKPTDFVLEEEPVDFDNNADLDLLNNFFDA